MTINKDDTECSAVERCTYLLQVILGYLSGINEQNLTNKQIKKHVDLVKRFQPNNPDSVKIQNC